VGSDLRLYRWQQLRGDDHGWSCQGLSKDSHSSRRLFDDLADFLVENGEVFAEGAILENVLRMSEVPAGHLRVAKCAGLPMASQLAAVVRLELAAR
jgi:hypothetical protein